MKVLIVVPAFNEEKSLPAVIADLEKHSQRNILVIDDGSEDRTSRVIPRRNVKTIRHLLNRGLGAALGTGFKYAKDQDFDILVTFDADGQHRARDIKELLAPLKDQTADVVIGSRLIRPDGMPWDRRLLNQISNWVTQLLYGVKATDTLSGLRAFNRRAIENITIKTDRMEVSNEFFKEIRRNKLRVCEVPVVAIYTEYSRRGGQSNLNALSIGFKMLLRLFR